MVLKRTWICIATILIGILELQRGATANALTAEQTIKIKKIAKKRTKQYADQNKIDFSWFGDRTIIIERDLDIGPPNL